MAGRVRQRGRIFGVASTAVVAIVLTAVVAWQATSRATAADDTTSSFVPVGPVRLTDTRRADCGCIRRNGSTIEIDIAAHPAIADDAVAVAVTITATATTAPGHVTAYPAGTHRPTVSTLNTRTDRTVANSAIIPVGPDGRIALFRLVSGELIVDVTGVFVPTAASRAGRFVPIPARRLVDTREPGPTSGALGANRDLTVQLPDGVASDATAVVVNVTTVGEPGPSHLSARRWHTCRAEWGVGAR